MSLLEVSSLKKSFIQNEHEICIFKNLNLNLTEGDTLAVMGKSGSGKSTLLSLLLGLDHPDEGNIVFDGKNYNTFSENDFTQLRKNHIGMIFQNHQLVETLTAWENVWLAAVLRNVSNPEDSSKQILEDVGLSHRLHHLPSQLSGGENQRVAIARALIGKPRIVLADEPNANLDVETGKVVMELMFDLVNYKKQTLLLVTHDNTLAKKCRNIMNMGT